MIAERDDKDVAHVSPFSNGFKTLRCFNSKSTKYKKVESRRNEVVEGRFLQENLIKNIKEFDILTDAQVAVLAGALERRWFDQADCLIYQQGEESSHFYILEDLRTIENA